MRKRKNVQKSYEPKTGFFGPQMEIEDSSEGEYTLEEFF